MAASVADLSPAVKAMQEDWTLSASLMGGTRAMRAAGKAYLPQWPNEDPGSYQARLATATLYPAYQNTVEILTGKVFSKPVTIGEDVPGRLKAWAEDIDLEGRNLSVFASDLMESALGQGVAGILIDYPKADGVRTLADERARGLRPYFVHIRAEQLLGWRAARRQGKWVVEQLRLLECVQESDGEFGSVEVQQVRVLTPGAWQVWRKHGEKAEWALHDFGTTTLGYVPFVPVYGKRTGFMLGKPPLIELAHMNVKHWQSQSDQDTLLHVARVPILVRTGIQDTVLPDGTTVTPRLTIGAGAAVDLPQGATLAFTEHTGASIGAGKISLDDLKEEMRQAGAEMLVIRPGNSTRIEAAADNAKSMCALQRVALGLQDALNAALQVMAEWVQETTGGHVTVFTDFGALSLDAAVKDLVSLQQGGILSKETTFKESQRRGVISADVDFGEEQQRIQEEGPALGTMGLDPATGLPLKAGDGVGQ